MILDVLLLVGYVVMYFFFDFFWLLHDWIFVFVVGMCYADMDIHQMIFRLFWNVFFLYCRQD